MYCEFYLISQVLWHYPSKHLFSFWSLLTFQPLILHFCSIFFQIILLCFAFTSVDFLTPDVWAHCWGVDLFLCYHHNITILEITVTTFLVAAGAALPWGSCSPAGWLIIRWERVCVSVWNYFENSRPKETWIQCVRWSKWPMLHVGCLRCLFMFRQNYDFEWCWQTFGLCLRFSLPSLSLLKGMIWQNLSSQVKLYS